MTLEIAAMAEIVVGYVLFSLALFKPAKLSKGQKKTVRAPASRWGIILQTIGFAFAWAYVRPDGFSEISARVGGFDDSCAAVGVAGVVRPGVIWANSGATRPRSAKITI